MKTVIKGIYYDTSTAQPLSTSCFSLHGVSAEETACQMPDGSLFILRRINGRETALLPATPEDFRRWQAYRSQLPTQLWLG